MAYSPAETVRFHLTLSDIALVIASIFLIR